MGLFSKYNPKSLPLKLLALMALLAGATACLPDQLPIEGRQLFSGRGIENISFVSIAGATHVLFEIRRTSPTPKGAGSVDMWVAPLDGSIPARRFFEGRADSSPVVRVVGTQGPQFWVARNEREVLVGQRAVRLVDRVRIDVLGNVLEQVRDTESGGDFSVKPWGPERFRKPLQDRAGMAWHLRDQSGRERVLDDVTGPLIPSDPGFFYVGGSALTLYWVPDLGAPAEPLRSGVTRTRFVGDQSAILTVPEEGRAVDVVFDLQRRTERKLPGRSICCWLGYERDRQAKVWSYAEARTLEAPARYHEYNIVTGAHVVVDLPLQMADLTRIEPRPRSDIRLFQDSAGVWAAYQPSANRSVAVLPLRVPSFIFSNDGRFLIYVQPVTQIPEPEGPLLIQDFEFAEPPRELSPPGTTALMRSQFFTLDTPAPAVVVFWARFGRAASDLYFAPLEGPGLQRVAEGIRDVSVTRTRVLGIVRTSLQDLVGDLVLKRLADDKEIVLGRSVDKFLLTEDEATKATKILYSLRTRKAADVEGLWVTELPQL